MIKAGDRVKVVDLSVLPAGNYITCNNEFSVVYIQGENAYIANNDMSIFLPIKALELVGKKVKENNVIYFTGQPIELKNKYNSVAKVYKYSLGVEELIRVELKIDKMVLPFHFSTLENVSKYLQGIGFKVELKKTETVAEITSEMKEKAKYFDEGKENYLIFLNLKRKEIRKSCFSADSVIGALYFDGEVADDFVKRLQAAYDREGWE